MWLHRALLACVQRLAVDGRPEVRHCALRSLVTTLTVYGGGGSKEKEKAEPCHLRRQSGEKEGWAAVRDAHWDWQLCLAKVLFPLLNEVGARRPMHRGRDHECRPYVSMHAHTQVCASADALDGEDDASAEVSERLGKAHGEDVMLMVHHRRAMLRRAPHVSCPMRAVLV
jgi:hypothetical protein